MKLSEGLTKIIGGGTPSKSNPDYWNGNIPWATVKDMADDKFSLSNTKDHISDAGLRNSSSNLIPAGSVITSTRMGLGRVFINKVDVAINQDLKALFTNEKLDKYFLLWVIALKRDYLNSIGSGTTVKGIRLELLRELEIPDLTIDKQRKVAGILCAYDDLIENNSKRIEKLESMARLLYRHYFEVPEADDWEELPLSDTLVVHRGKSYKSSELSESEGLPFVNLKCVNRGGGFRKDGLKLFTGSFKEGQRVEKGDLVMAVTDMTQERMIIARAARVPSLDGGYGVISMDMVKLEPKEGFVKDYLYALLRWSRFADEVKNHANGANVLHLIPARITDFSLPMPPQELQQEFSENISPLLNLIDNLQLKNEALVKARDLLLPRLMSGEIEV